MDDATRRELHDLRVIAHAALGLAEMIIGRIRQLHPNEFDEELRLMRLLVERAEAPGTLLDDPRTLQAWQVQLRSLERALDHPMGEQQKSPAAV